MKAQKSNYGTAILEAFEYLLENYPEVFVIGQGLWSPWYVGNSMTNLDKKFGVERIIDTPVSESACTGAAVGASLAGMKPIVVHPRMDFMLYAMDAIVNQASKWSHMLGGQAHPGVTIRGIINRGGEQGAQHSQALHGNPHQLCGYTEKDAFSFLSSCLPTLFPAVDSLTVRPHPSQTKADLSWMNSYNRQYKFSISNEPSLGEQILRHDVVIGLESMALIVAILANKPVFSAIPPNFKRCSIPYSEILHLSDLI